ncbi:tectonin domain-containing protein [Shumkonia mesophila]|uniref:tectonin domain-containing protein n=1 Tax=Shumkonia mesophila TaxID=2838854 RepID=UPI0029350005|nr:tectonin domain-containing protein [Shumkonia mesophila]
MNIPFKSALRTFLARGALLVLATFGVTASVSDAAAVQTQAAFSEGHALCGAMDLRTGQVLGACGFAKATKTGKAVGKCPQGSFFDIGTWSCFSCPSGFNRTGFAVDTPMACSKEISPQYQRATRVSGQKSCPAGSFKDGRNGGECWSCPSGYGRTLSAVDAWDACGKFAETARRAEFIDRVCAEGTFSDPNGGCYTCPAGYRRTAAAVTAQNACFRNELLKAATKEAALTCKAGEHFDFVDGGTCWSCPEGSTRSVSGVKTNNACEYTNMRWESAKRTPNGLFALPGAHEIAAQVVLERTRIDAAIAKFSSESKLNKTKNDELTTKAWDLIKTEPETSPILKAAVYDHVFEVIKNGAKTKAERDLLSYMADYVQQSRLLAASEMQKVWQSWVRGRQALTASRGNNLVNAYDTGVAPPDMAGLVGDVMLLGPGAAVVMSFIGASTAEAISPAVAQLTARFAMAIFPHRFRDATAAAVTAARTGTTAATSASSAGIGAFGGPLIILTATSILASIATDIALEQNKQEAIVNDALQIAQRPVNLARLLLTEEGRTEVASNWTLMTQEPYKPNARTWAALMPQTQQAPAGGNAAQTPALVGDRVVVNAPSGAVAQGASKWVKIDGAARDVAIGSDGTAYVIGTTQEGSGYQIFKRAKTATTWSKLSGAATRIAVFGTQAWVVNSKGMIFAQSGTGWKKVPGPAAQDIGASAKGVWIIGVDGKIHQRAGNGWQHVPGNAQRIDIDRDGRPWVVNEQGNIFVHNNNLQWDRLPGAAVDVAVDAPGAAQVVGSDGKVYVFNGTKLNWDPVSQDTDAQAIGAGDGQVWRLTKTNDIYRLQ